MPYLGIALVVQDFIRAVRELGAVAKTVYVAVLPRNSAWLEPSPQGLERERSALAQVAEQTGVQVLDFSRRPEFTAADFSDPVHLSQTSGVSRFSILFADAVAGALSTAR